MKATIYDVANEARVSMATVSRVVNGQPNVSPETRKKVKNAIKKLKYRPNDIARGLASKKTTTVGVMIPSISNMYYGELAEGSEDIASMYKYNIILSSSDENEDKEAQMLNTLLSKQVDGIIYMGEKVSEQLQEEFDRSSVPVVLAGTGDASKNIASINIDCRASTKEAVEHFITNGHRKIAFVGSSLTRSTNGIARLGGYKEALQEAGIAFDENYVIEAKYNYKEGVKVWERLSSFKERPNAILVTDDELAVGILNAALDDGVRVPEDLEIITSNNTKLTYMNRYKLSSVAQPLYDIGAVAMRLLTKLMAKEEVEDKNVLLPHRLELRDTTK